MMLLTRLLSVFGAALFTCVVVICLCPSAIVGSPEPRGPRFGNKPHPGRVEHIHPGTHGEVVFHQDPRIFQGSDPLKQGSAQIDAGGYWESWKFTKIGREGVVNQKLDDSSGYYEGISKPKYEYRRYQGYRNINAAGSMAGSIPAVTISAALSALALILPLRVRG